MHYNSNFEKKFLDIGTGDGRYIYKNALENPKNLYIGIDPAKNLEDYQRQINRKRLKNAQLIQSSIENYDPKVENFFDEISIILPWGNLLKYCVTVDKDFFQRISRWLKPGGELKVIFGFNEELEEKETKRLNLRDLNEKEVEFLKENYSTLPNLQMTKFENVFYLDLETIETTWAKKLKFGANRNYFTISLKKI
jgi:16S rRNA (adenine(1408)-N(1))-methyltransferase